METKFDTYQTKKEQKVNSILEGIITIMRQIEETKKSIKELSSRVDRLEHNQQVILRSTGDTMIMTNNNTNDIEDIKGNTESISEKIDNLDYTVKNLRIYKYYNGE